jgi:glycosyltransferase involved in cell wall biosynthesis
LGKALNEGLKHCSYDIVARMDTDDIAKPDRFEKQKRHFETRTLLIKAGTKNISISVDAFFSTSFCIL